MGSNGNNYDSDNNDDKNGLLITHALSTSSFEADPEPNPGLPGSQAQFLTGSQATLQGPEGDATV